MRKNIPTKNIITYNFNPTIHSQITKIIITYHSFVTILSIFPNPKTWSSQFPRNFLVRNGNLQIRWISYANVRLPTGWKICIPKGLASLRTCHKICKSPNTLSNYARFDSCCFFFFIRMLIQDGYRIRWVALGAQIWRFYLIQFWTSWRGRLNWIIIMSSCDLN